MKIYTFIWICMLIRIQHKDWAKTYKHKTNVDILFNLIDDRSEFFSYCCEIICYFREIEKKRLSLLSQWYHIDVIFPVFILKCVRTLKHFLRLLLSFYCVTFYKTTIRFVVVFSVFFVPSFFVADFNCCSANLYVERISYLITL